MAKYRLDYTGAQVDLNLGKAATALQGNSAITPGTNKTKISYDAKGLVTAGGDLAASDIPNLDASKITTGTLSSDLLPSIPDSKIASASTWSAKAAKSTVYTGTLLANGWSNNTQTLTISGLSTSGYAYTVSPTSGDFEDYASAMIWANDVTVANNITFNCKEVPTSDIDIIILGCEVA